MSKSKKETNYAFIDSQNLNLGVRSQGWILDFGKFLKYIRNRFRVTKAFLFIGYIPSNQKLYDYLEGVGYELIFKPTIHSGNDTKGNVDAELVLQAMHELCEKNFDTAVIVSGDGDFHCLIKYLDERNLLKRLIVPNKFGFSSLLRKYSKQSTFISSRLRGKLEYKKK